MCYFLCNIFFEGERMKRVSSWFVGILSLFISIYSAAEGTKIGVVDLQKIMQTSSQMKVIQDK